MSKLPVWEGRFRALKEEIDQSLDYFLVYLGSLTEREYKGHEIDPGEYRETLAKIEVYQDLKQRAIWINKGRVFWRD